MNTKQEIILRRLDKNLAQLGLPSIAGARSHLDYPGSTWADLDHVQDPIQWDWFGWLPLGFLTILASKPGVGKSALCLRIAASYITGLAWPDNTAFGRERGPILWCEGESGLTLHLDRIRHWGLDTAQIINPLPDPRQNFKLDIPEHVAALCVHAFRDDVRLIVLDSLGSLQSRDKAKAEVNSVTQLANLALAIRKPVLLTHHLRKDTPLDRHGQPTLSDLFGSSIIARIPRVVWALSVPDSNEPGNLLLSVIKNNLAAFPDPIGVRIGAQGLHFGPPPQPPPSRSSQQDRAAAFLQDLLAGGPVPARQVKAEGQAADLSGPTLDRAKRQLGIIPRKSAQAWYWQLPPK